MPIATLVNPVFVSRDGAGRPNNNGWVGVYVAGTSFVTLATIYSDQLKTTELTNPVRLDPAGIKEIWYDVKVDIQEKSSATTWAGATLIRDTLNLDPNATATVSTNFNLAENGSFEVDSDSDGQPDNWTISPYSGSAIAISSDIATNGNKSLEFNTDGAAGGGGTATSSKFAVTEGTNVAVSWSFYATHASTVNKVRINWYDEDDVYKGFSQLTMPASGSVPTSWTSYTESVTVHADATKGEIVLNGISTDSGGSNLTSKAYFDGITVTNHPIMVALDETQTLTNKTLSSPTINSPTINGELYSSPIELVRTDIKTPVDTSTGSGGYTTSSIPDWVKRITLSLNQVSVSGTDPIVIHIGDSGGIESTGYNAAIADINVTTVTSGNISGGFPLTKTSAGATTYSGSIIITLLDKVNFTYSAISNISGSDAHVHLGAGTKSLTTILTQFELDTIGTDTFDGGELGIYLEG